MGLTIPGLVSIRNLGARDHHYCHDKTECLHFTDTFVYTVAFQLSDCHSVCGQSQHPLFKWVESTHYHLSHSPHSHHTNTCSGSFQTNTCSGSFQTNTCSGSFQLQKRKTNTVQREIFAGPNFRDIPHNNAKCNFHDLIFRDWSTSRPHPCVYQYTPRPVLTGVPRDSCAACRRY